MRVVGGLLAEQRVNIGCAVRDRAECCKKPQGLHVSKAVGGGTLQYGTKEACVGLLWREGDGTVGAGVGLCSRTLNYKNNVVLRTLWAHTRIPIRVPRVYTLLCYCLLHATCAMHTFYRVLTVPYCDFASYGEAFYLPYYDW